MDNDIIIERSPATHVMKLDDDEQALMDEIQITTKPAPRRPRPQPVARQQPPVDVQAEIDAFTNPVKRTARAPPQPQYQSFPDDEEEEEDFQDQQGGFHEQSYEPGPTEVPSPGYTSVDDEKADLLNKLSRLEKKGLNVNKKLNAYSDISEIRTEYKRIVYSIEAE